MIAHTVNIRKGHYTYVTVEIVEDYVQARIVISNDNPVTASLHSFQVNPESERGKGYGTAVITTALEYIKQEMKVDRVRLFVLSDNVLAIKLYERLGFKLTPESANTLLGVLEL